MTEPDENEIDSLDIWEHTPHSVRLSFEEMYEFGADIVPQFLGFVTDYKHLSAIIPQHFTIIDVGCAYQPQSYYFQNHNAYYGVAPDEVLRFEFGKRCHSVRQTIGMFIKTPEFLALNLDETFAICNYVPPWYSENAAEITRKTFRNLYVFYPHGNELVVKI